MHDNRIDKEVLEISGAGAYMDMHAYYEGYLHTKSLDVWLQTIEYVDILRDYNGNVSDLTTTSFLMPLGDFVKKFYPERDNLQITIIGYTVGKKTTTKLKFIITGVDDDIKNGVYDKKTIHELNKEGMTKLTGECVSLTADKLRNVTAPGAYEKATVDDVLITTMSKALGGIEVFDFSLGKETHIADSNNKRIYDHIVIPDSINILDIPSYMQNAEYGIFNGDVGTYIQNVDDNESIHVYPLYRPNLLPSSKLKLQVTVVPSATMASVDSTYAMDGNVLKILTNVFVKPDADNEAKLKSSGSGVNMTDDETILKRPVEVSPDEVKVNSENTKRKYVHKKTADGEAKFEQHENKSNTYSARSSVLKNDGKFIQVQWNFSNARLLTPAMGIIYVIEESDGIKTYEGVLHGVHITCDNNSKMEVAILSIFLTRNTSNGVTNSSLSGAVDTVKGAVGSVSSAASSVGNLF